MMQSSGTNLTLAYTSFTSFVTDSLTFLSLIRTPTKLSTYQPRPLLPMIVCILKILTGKWNRSCNCRFHPFSSTKISFVVWSHLSISSSIESVLIYPQLIFKCNSIFLSHCQLDVTCPGHCPNFIFSRALGSTILRD